MDAVVRMEAGALVRLPAVEADQPFGEVERTSSRLGAEEGTTAVAVDKEELPRAT